MRLSFLIPLVSALSAVANPLGSLASEEAKDMAASLVQLGKAIDVDNCKVAKAQLQVFKHSLIDGIVEGHVEDEKQLVKYITREQGETMLKKIQHIRDKGGNINLSRELGNDKAPPKNPSGQKFESDKTDSRSRKGWKGRKGKGKGKGTNKGSGKGSGGSSKDRKPREEIVLDNSFAADTEYLRNPRSIKLSCGASRRVLKVVRNFVVETPKIGKSTDGKSVFYVHPKEEQDLKRKIVRAATRRD
ncbi:hypothetical protein jhhlp_004581 [Lomentospora prolificans]|uniref:Uncharacterized protein n=1 Tax=Lomentospora prolificans TaxID=41688 RepID=A0A2N3NBZ8_9PEZI|nr:hypothetical protein jhhlp_004581 [Lomentospora prolificans]